MPRQLLATVRANLLHEALTRAVKVAPTKGAGFDRAGGLKFTVQDGTIWVQATDLERTFFQKIKADTHVDMSFRIGTSVARFVSSLPMGGDQEVRFHLDDKQRIEVQYMKSPTKIQVPQI